MNEEPATSEPVEQETKPSLLATLSLILGLVPWVMVGQQFLLDELPWGRSSASEALAFLSGFGPFLIFGAVVASIICGWMALAKMKADKMLRGRWKAVTGIRLAYLFPIFFSVWVMPPPCGGREKARTASCISNLKAIATALTIYADDHLRQMPVTLDELINGTYLPIGSTATRCSKDQSHYIYPGAGRIWQSSGTEISVYCSCDHLNERVVLFNDGGCASLPVAELQQLLADAEKTGQSGR